MSVSFFPAAQPRGGIFLFSQNNFRFSLRLYRCKGETRAPGTGDQDSPAEYISNTRKKGD